MWLSQWIEKARTQEWYRWILPSENLSGWGTIWCWYYSLHTLEFQPGGGGRFPQLIQVCEKYILIVLNEVHTPISLLRLFPSKLLYRPSGEKIDVIVEKMWHYMPKFPTSKTPSSIFCYSLRGPTIMSAPLRVLWEYTIWTPGSFLEFDSPFDYSLLKISADIWAYFLLMKIDEDNFWHSNPQCPELFFEKVILIFY